MDARKTDQSFNQKITSTQLNNRLWMSPNYRPNWATVIITAYQRADFIIQTVNSIYEQTYRPIELIIIDDGSTDQTKMLLSKWWENIIKSDNFEFTYIYQENTGAPKARNRALGLSTGEFIQEVGSDDLIHPAKLEANVLALKNCNNCQSVWSPLKRFSDKLEHPLDQNHQMEKAEILIKRAKVVTRENNIFYPQFLPSAALHRREVFLKTGPWLEHLKRWQDLEYQSRMSFHVKKYILIDEPLYFFRQHDGVRIHSQYKQKDGIAAGLESLKAIEINLDLFSYQNPSASLDLCNFYISLVILATKHSTHRELKSIIEGAMRHRHDKPFKIRMKLFLILVRLLGGNIASNLLGFYLKLKQKN